MSPYAFVVTWVAHSTVLGLCFLLLPRVFRVADPRLLASWWGVGAAGVVLAPLLPLLAPARRVASAPIAAFVESTTVALAPALPAAAMPSPLVVLTTVWAAGALARLVWLAVGRRRRSRCVAAAVRVEDDPALDRARNLVPARGVRFPLASVPVDVLASASASPCAFGWRRVRVLVPHALQEQPESQRVAVYLHELLHVARGDVHRAWGDEAVRILCWWQPAVWWLLARLRLAREMEVDSEVVARMGSTRAYVDALVWCSTLRPVLSFGPHAGGSRHALVRRVALMCRGGSEMSRTRRWITNVAMTMIVAAATATIGVIVPLRAAAGLQDDGKVVFDRPGPLERAAVLPTLDAPAPRRVLAVDPVWTGTEGHRFRVHLVIDAMGRVAESRLVGRYESADAPARTEVASAAAAALDAVRQWQFEAPVAAPLLLATEVTVGTVSPSTSSTATSQPPLRVGGGVKPPKKLLDVPPVYPEVAKDAGVSGVVIVEATIDTEGHVQDVRVVRSIPLLDEAALDAVKQWRYSPTWLNGEPVPVKMTMTINFTLQ